MCPWVALGGLGAPGRAGAAGAAGGEGAAGAGGGVPVVVTEAWAVVLPPEVSTSLPTVASTSSAVTAMIARSPPSAAGKPSLRRPITIDTTIAHATRMPANT